MREARETYDNIEIPLELHQVVNEAIQNSKKNQPFKKGKRILRFGGVAVASFLLVSVIGLNTSQSFAMEVQKLPVVGSIASVLILRSYHTDQDGIQTKGKVAEVRVEDTAGLDVADQINQEIQKMCDAYVSEAGVRAEEYRQAFLDTGGSEEEWEAHNIEINVDYDIKNQTDEYLSFVINGTENWSSAGSFTQYYNLNLKTWKYVTLEDLLGKEYKNLANESIRAQMAENQKKNPQITYWSKEEGGFASVNENSMFYINEKGNPVILFEKYEIGPGSLGMPEFEIVR